MITPRQLEPWVSNKTVSGHWWPKDQPELRYSGVLTTESGVSTLTVTAPPIGQEVFALGSTQTLHGAIESPNGTAEVTLWDRAGFHLEHAGNGTEHSRRVTHVIEGSHVGDYDDALFRYSAVQFNDLGIWSRFRTPVAEGTPESELPGHTFGTLQPYQDLFDASYSVTVHLEYPGRVEMTERFPGGVIRNHPDADARVVFEVTPPAPARFHEFLRNDMQALLTFCYQSGAPIVGAWIGVDRENFYPFHRRDTFRERAVRHLGDFQMVVTPEQSSFGQLVEAWWRVLDDFFPAAQVTTSYLHATRGLLEQSTSSVLAATERIHALIGPTQTRFPAEVINENRRKIKQALPGQTNAPFRAFLGEKLQENRPTLETRLFELVEVVTLERFAMLSIDPREWADKFKAVRNKLAHTGAHVLRRGDSGDDLELVNSQTRAILALLLVAQMGLRESDLDRAAGVLGAFPHRSW